MTKVITWDNQKRKLSQLIPWDRNPRQIKSDQVKRLQESLAEFGQIEPVCIGPGNELYNGHQRLKSWAAKFGDIEIDVRVSYRALTEKEREKLTVFLHKGAAGEWDFDELANSFEMAELVEWGFEEDELLGVDYKNPHLEESTESVVRARSMARILISVPVDMAIDAKEIIDQLADIEGIEILYGAN
jgi:hypothetical protein